MILVCLDKFKGCLTAAEATAHLVTGITRAGGTAVARPVADGGEGTVEALLGAGYREVEAVVSGPTGEPVGAAFAVRGDRAVVELARAAGLALLPGGRPAPLTASTRGVGEVILHALDLACREVVLAVGGSATTDGGAGMLAALGAKLLDRDGRPVRPGGGALADIARVDLSGLDRRLAAADLVVATDVDNPLLGPTGAAAVFGPQKGATPRDVTALERGLARFAAALAEATGHDLSGAAGAGAAGGTAFGALSALGARRAAGVDMVLREVGVHECLEDADLVVVGEGSFDAQSLRGKAPVGVARAARRAGVPVVVVAGVVDVAAAELRDLGVVTTFSLLERAGDLRAALTRAPALLTEIGRDLVTGPLLPSPRGRTR